MDLTNKHLAKLLRQVAAAYLLKNENRFKIIAYERAADTIDHLNQEVKDIWEDNKLFTIQGIGPSILSHIEDYFKKAEKSHLIKVIQRLPPSVFILMDIPGIGPKKAFKLTKALDLTNPETAIEDLKTACLAGKVATLENFGEKSQTEILNSINLFKKRVGKKERMPLPYAYSLAEDILSYLRKHPLVQKAEALGSLRRMTATIGDIDIAVKIKNLKPKVKSYKDVIDYFIHYPNAISVVNAGDKKASIIVSGNQQIDLRVISKNAYGSMMQYFTGSKEHNIKLREYALKKGLSLSEYGIKRVKSPKSKVQSFNDEKSLYHFLDLDYIPPELREGTDEIRKAVKHELPKLIELKDIKGDFHIHSSYDLEPSHDLGANTYQEILQKAHQLNYEYVAFSDHNPSIGNHTNADIIKILKKRNDFIRQKLSKFFISLEVDILPNGDLALPDEAIDYLDMMIVSIHSRFEMEKDAMTKRILKALECPKVKILGHPTGRLLDQREEIAADWERIFENCKNKDIALEINAYPKRLDLPDVLVRQAVEMGVKLVIDTDAHDIDGMEMMSYGAAVARRGFAKKTDIINTMSYNDVKRWLKIDKKAR